MATKATKDVKIAELVKTLKEKMGAHWWGKNRYPSDRDVLIFALERTLVLEKQWAEEKQNNEQGR